MDQLHDTRSDHLKHPIPVMLIYLPFLTVTTHTLLFLKEMLSLIPSV
jgi:hypothetical protein